MGITVISFSDEEIREIQKGNKTEAQIKIKCDLNMILGSPYHLKHPELSNRDIIEEICIKPCKMGDVLAVRQAFDYLEGWKIGDPGIDGMYFYKEDGDLRPTAWRGKWRSPTQMPKSASRLFIKIKDVQAEQLDTVQWVWKIEFERCEKPEK